MSYSKPKSQRLLELIALVLACVLIAPLALSQGFFRVSPGPLNEGHAAYDNSDSCDKCHDSGKGVTNQKCLDCHAAVLHKGGMHTTLTGRPCINCHVEHRGRAFNIIEWKDVGGRDGFRHDITGFSLSNHHGKVACTKCHVRRLKTGRTSYLGLSRNCASCHAGVHGFTRAELRDQCEICHQSGQTLAGQILQNWGSQHQKYSKVELNGKHTSLACVKCHEQGRMAGRSVPRGCADCHRASHPVTRKTRDCVECHAQSGSFKGARIDHADYGFALTGKHAKASCADCHVRGGKATTVSKTCVSCHTATHPVAKSMANCATCHASGGSFKGARIDHAQYGFALHGKHTKIACGRCHKGNAKLSYREGACTSCHTHRKAHKGQFKDKPCASCHIEGGKRNAPFDHQVDTRFPLTGFHAEPELKNNCERCHPGRIYRTNKLNCVDCHEDKHKGELGSDCTKCHATTLHFNAPRSKDFDHSKFPLEGKHTTIPCISCHVNSQYKLGKRTCYDCHAKDDKHQGKLGKDCEKCHRPEKGARKFNHEAMTTFQRTGAHRTTACSHCHRTKNAKRAALSVAEWKQVKPRATDLHFPVLGKRCIDCHQDPHAGQYGSDCAACHTTDHFERITGGRAKSIRPKDHGGSWLRRHTILPESDSEPGAEKRACATCHGSPSCTHCHRVRAPRSHTGLWRARTHGAAAAFDPNACSTCHRAASCIQCHRRTAPLNHRGAWPSLHGFAAGGFAGNNCFVCHRRSDCAACHRAR